MKPTIKCMKLDYMLLKPYFKSILLVLLVPLLFPIFTGSLFEGLSFAVTIMAMTTAYTFSVAEKNSLDRFYGFLPIKRNCLVRGRYLAIFSIGFLAILFEVVIQVIILSFVTSSIPQTSEIIASILICTLLFCIYAGVQIPGYYKYGSIKGKIFMFIPTVGFLIFYYIIRLLSRNGVRDIPHFLQNPVTLMIGAVILIVLFIAVSVIVSTKILVKTKS